MECLLFYWRRPKRHHRLKPARIRRLTYTQLYFEEFTMSLAQIKFTLPPEDANDADHVDIFDNQVAIGSAPPSAGEFSTAELAPGDHAFTAVVRSKAGPDFDSDPSNVATVTVPVPVQPPVKLTAISDLTATLVEAAP
jgi:hypothetical protein